MAARFEYVLLLYVTSLAIVHLKGENLLEPEVGIKFITEPDDLIAVKGKSAILHCEAFTILQADLTITWTQNDREIIPDSRRTVHENGSLIFHQVISKKKSMLSDEGIYRCVATVSQNVLISRPAVVKIAAFSKEFPMFPKVMEAGIGDTVRLYCKFNTTPEARITWMKDKEPLPKDDKRFVTTISGVLYIVDARQSDSGKYSCNGMVGLLKRSRNSDHCNVTISEKSKKSNIEFVSPFSKNVTVRLNEELILDCAVSSSDGVYVIWTYRQFGNDKEMLLSDAKKGVNILSKMRMDLTDSGLYTCIASRDSTTENAFLKRSILVDVVTPPIIIKYPKSNMIPVAKRVRLECVATGHPQPDIVWLHNGKRLQLNGRIKKKENELVLTNTVSDDYGIYQCFANNKYGSMYGAISLYVITSPYQPDVAYQLKCSPLDSSRILLTWKHTALSEHPIFVKENKEDNPFEPEIARVSPDQPTISKAYSVHFHPTAGGEESTELSVNESYIVNKLKSNTNYTFYVRAYNGRSASDQSEQVVCSTVFEENTSCGLDLSTIDSTSILVTWSAKECSVQSDTGKRRFSVQWRKAKEPYLTEKAEVMLSQTSYTIKQLEPGCHYEVRVLSTQVDDSDFEYNTWSSITTPDISYLPPPKLSLNVINPTTVQVSWEISDDKNLQVDEYRLEIWKKNEDSNKGNNNNVRLIPASQKYYFVSQLEPNRTYEMKLSASVNGVQGKQVTGEVTTPSENSWNYELSPPVDVKVTVNTYDSLTVSWTAPSNSGNVSRYTISCWSSQRLHPIIITTEELYMDMGNLSPDTQYMIKVQSGDNNNQLSDYTDPIVVHTPHFLPEVVEGISWISLNSTAVRVSWTKLDSNLINLYIISYTWMANIPIELWAKVNVSAQMDNVIITDLKSEKHYFVTVQAKSDIGGLGPINEPLTVFTESIKQDPYVNFVPKVTSEFIQFTDEQLLGGIFIGLAVACLFIAFCVIVLYCMKKEHDKRQARTAEEVRRTKMTKYFADNERHEVLLLEQNSNNKTSNTCNGNNVQAPLLVQSESYSSPQINSIAVSVQSSSVNADTIASAREELSELLVCERGVGGVEEISLHNFDIMDQEGGDSGYCDRHLSSLQSPDSTSKRTRNFSDATVDDGFSEVDAALSTC